MKQAKQNKLVGQTWEEGAKKITHADIISAEGGCVYIANRNTYIEYYDLEKHQLPFDEIQIDQNELANVRRVIDSDVVIGQGGNGKVIIYSKLSELPGTKGAKGVIIGKEKSLNQAKQHKLVGQTWEEGAKKITHADIIIAEGGCLYIANRNIFVEYYDPEKHQLPFYEIQIDENEQRKVLKAKE